MFYFDGNQINLLIALASGVITFFASCLLPLVPTYLAYLGGMTVKKSGQKNRIFINGLIFTIGFILAFVALGATASAVGQVFARHRILIQKIGGIFFILVGIFMLEVVRLPFLYKEKKFGLPKKLRKFEKLNSLLIGFTFGFAWTPCIGPVLGVILFWASQAENFIKGTGLLLAYGIGMGIPFVIIALFFDKLAGKLSKASRFGALLQKISGAIIIIVGVLLVLGKIELLSIKILQLLNMSTLSV